MTVVNQAAVHPRSRDHSIRRTEGAFPWVQTVLHTIHVTPLCGDYIIQTVAYEGLTPNLLKRTSYLTVQSM